MNYLIEFRFHGYAKWYAKNIIYDVARKFNVKGVTENRAVPHTSLFGPFQTNDERRLVSEIISIGKRYDLVPFRIKVLEKRYFLQFIKIFNWKVF